MSRLIFLMEIHRLWEILKTMEENKFIISFKKFQKGTLVLKEYRGDINNFKHEFNLGCAWTCRSVLFLQ
jgi:hypothetical protein